MQQQRSVLIIGSGSMGQRFARILEKMECSVTFYQYSQSQKIDSQYEVVTTLKNLGQYTACFICSPTATHAAYLKKCIVANVPVFVEKPIADSVLKLTKILENKQPNQVLMVGFNLRYFPIISEIKKLIPKLGAVHYAHFDVGQYLPSWRPDSDYTTSYSAIYEKGGGVALDLIHELDLALDLFPDIDLQKVTTEKLSSLKIDVEDYVEFAFSNPRVRITLEYLSAIKTRIYKIVAENGTLVCDVNEHKLTVSWNDGTITVLSDPHLFDREESFVREVTQFLQMISKKKDINYTERELGIDALKLALQARKKYV